MSQPAHTAARRLVDTLVMNGVDHVFCVPGESYLAVLDALHDVRDRIRLVVCRHEAGAANMAEAYGKLTGRPGVCMVTRGPGATHASIGVHTAHQDSTPMILFVGQVGLADRGRGAFQEVDYREVFGGLAKWATEIESPERTTEIVERAFATALQGRMGPVVVALPEDILHADGGPAPLRAVEPARSALDPSALARIGERLANAERPIVVLGGSGWTQEAALGLAAWAEGLGLPIALSFRRKDLIDNRRPCYAGDLGLGPNPKLIQRVKDADLILAIGARLGENPTQGYSLLDREKTGQTLVHIHPGPEELNRVWPAAIAAAADVSLAANAIATLNPGRTWSHGPEAHADFEAFIQPVAVTGAVNMSEVMGVLREVLPEDAIVTNGAGNFAAWLHRFFPHRGPKSQLAPTSGAMGYGVPAAVGAAIVASSRTVVNIAGDGDFMMLVQELATLRQYDARAVFVVVDNGTYGTIRMHQERDYPTRISGTDLKNPDFVALGRAFGLDAWRVEKTADFRAALEASIAAPNGGLIHLITSAEDIAPGRTITQLRAG